MIPTNELIDDLLREKVLRARAMPPEEKVFAGAVLFDMACEWTRAGIRQQHPDADERRVLEILREWLALARLLANWDLYQQPRLCLPPPSRELSS